MVFLSREGMDIAMLCGGYKKNKALLCLQRKNMVKQKMVEQ
jgi:hypothetical protein